jgi:hypothetical protein
MLGEIMVTAAGSNSNGDLTFQIESYISSLDSTINANQALVTLQGTSFGSDPGPLSRSTAYEHISIGGTWIPNYDVVSWSNNQIQFLMDVATPSGMVVVTTNGYESNSVPYTAPGQGFSGNVYLPMLRR